jgi:hypothetical protein
VTQEGIEHWRERKEVSGVKGDLVGNKTGFLQDSTENV